MDEFPLSTVKYFPPHVGTTHKSCVSVVNHFPNAHTLAQLIIKPKQWRHLVWRAPVNKEYTRSMFMVINEGVATSYAFIRRNTMYTFLYASKVTG